MIRFLSFLLLTLLLPAAWSAGPAAPPGMSASELIGKRVASVDGKSLGKVEDLIVDPSGRYMPHVVLSFGGVAGAGDKWFVFPVNYLMRDENRDGLVLAAKREHISESAGFDRSNWPYRPQLARASGRR
jgi:sporulation protein YlmC with PRC-barrel domain